MKNVTGWILFAAVLVPSLSTASELVSFVSCPIYRDTQAGRKSGCWLADDPQSGRRYDITQSPTKPDWNYAVLVEGKAVELADDVQELTPCGGLVLEPVRVSVLAESCPAYKLPAEGYAGRPYTLPARNVRPLSMAREQSPGPYNTQTFYIFFDHNKDFIIYQFGDYFLDEAIAWIRAANPKRIEITGFAATVPTEVSGRILEEDPDLGQRRAEKLTEALYRLGVEPKSIRTTWKKNPRVIDVEDADGLPASSLRRVEIKVVM